MRAAAVALLLVLVGCYPEPRPCPDVAALRERLKALEAEVAAMHSGSIRSCAILAERCESMAALVDGSLRSFIEAHVDPAERARRENRVSEFRGVGGGSD